MRHLASLLALVIVCLGGTGCALFDKNSKDSNGQAKANGNSGKATPQKDDPLLGGGGSAPVTPAPSNPFSSSNQASANNPGGMLAGHVVDVLDRPQGNAHVRCVRMDEKDQEVGPDVSVHPDGSFIIVGLQSGANYKLIARAKNGDQMLAGIKYAEAPNIRMLIQIDKNFAGADTPPVPGPPAYQPKNDKPIKTSGVNPSFDADWATFGTTRPAETGNAIAPVNLEPDLPVVMRVPSAPVTSPTAVAPMPPSNNGWAPTPNWSPSTEGPRTWPPSLEIRGPQMKPSAEMQKPWPGIDMQKPVPVPSPSADDPPPPKFPEPGPMSLEVPPSGPARVPSCVLVGGRLQNLALNDINGQPWEFRQHHGKVVLLDFWGTFCPPCKLTMPKLRELQNKFGSKLEIVGIAYERDGSPQEQAHRISSMCQSMQVSHRQLLGGGTYCPVLTQFRVTGLPTLILLDQDGVVLFRCQGEPDRGTMEELERRILRQINY